jgi:aspartate aminotransferase-like enzyme
MSHINLRIPGPTPLPPEVTQALYRPMISHRGPEYIQLHSETISMAKQFFQTKNDLFLFTSSGTGTMEAAIVNMLSPGDTVLGVSIGLFGNRAIEVAKAYGMNVIELRYPMGESSNPDDIAKIIKEHPEVKAILITQNETSTGITNDLRSIVKEVNKYAPDKNQPLFLVDAVSSMGNVDIPVDELGLDVVYTSTQKAWMSPPGIALVSVSARAWSAYNFSSCPKYYFDFAKMKKYNDKGQTPETPAISTIFALNAALKIMTTRGVKETFAYYADMAAYTRKQLTDNGFKLFGDQTHASNSVSACLVPDGVEDKAFRGLIKKNYSVILSGGKGEAEGKIVRVAHMGWVTKPDIDEVISAMASARKELVGA